MARKGSTLNWINHLGLIRGRFIGSGSLVVTTFSLQQNTFKENADVALSLATDKYVETLSNFRNQKMQVEFATELIDEWFNVSDVIVLIKPVESGYSR